MRIKNYIIIVFLLLMARGTAFSQEVTTEMRVYFRVNESEIDPDFYGNAGKLDEIVNFLQALKKDRTRDLVSVTFCGSVSPEGCIQTNARLEKDRMYALEEYVSSKVDHLSGVIDFSPVTGIRWDELKQEVEESWIGHKEEILEILKYDLGPTIHHGMEVNYMVAQLMDLHQGKVWDDMEFLLFDDMRYASVIVVTSEPEL